MGDQKGIVLGVFFVFSCPYLAKCSLDLKGSNLQWSVESQPSGNLPLLPSVVPVQASTQTLLSHYLFHVTLTAFSMRSCRQNHCHCLLLGPSPHMHHEEPGIAGVQSYLLKCLNWIMWTLHPLGYEQVRFCSALGSAWESGIKVTWFWQL